MKWQRVGTATVCALAVALGVAGFAAAGRQDAIGPLGNMKDVGRAWCKALDAARPQLVKIIDRTAPGRTVIEQWAPFGNDQYPNVFDPTKSFEFDRWGYAGCILHSWRTGKLGQLPAHTKCTDYGTISITEYDFVTRV